MTDTEEINYKEKYETLKSSLIDIYSSNIITELELQYIEEEHLKQLHKQQLIEQIAHYLMESGCLTFIEEKTDQGLKLTAHLIVQETNHKND